MPSVVSVDEAARIALQLPEVTEGERHGTRTWFVAAKAFAWERPFSKADIRRFGDVRPPDGAILAVRVEDLGEKEAVLAAQLSPKTALSVIRVARVRCRAAFCHQSQANASASRLARETF